jgi:hypothetical protein
VSSKYRILLVVLFLASFVVNLVSYAQGEQPPQSSPWGEVIDANGNILFDNLSDIGEIQVQADWMPNVPFIDGQATYHRYLTPSGNVVVLPSASTLFFMAINPQESGLDLANSELGNGIGALETIFAGYMTPEDLHQMGYASSEQFFQDVIDGHSSIWSFGGQHMLNFLMGLMSGSLADQNLYTMLLLYTAGNCAAVPGGCPSRAVTPTPTPPSICSAPFIQTSPIQVTGGSSEGGKIAPPNPVVIGQDPERRGVDVKVNVLIPPVVYHFSESIRHDDQICVWDSTGLGSGCSKHSGDSHWTTAVHTWYECVEHTQVFPDHLNSAQVSICLTAASRNWILTDLAQAYPGAHLFHPDFSYSYPGPGTLLSDQSVSWTITIPRVQTADPGDFVTSVLVRTTGTTVSAPRQVQIGLGQFTVDLVRVTLIDQP